MKKFIAGFVLATLVAAVPVFGQGSLSSQVLRLLTRDNTWSGVNTYDPTVGIVIGTNGSDPTGGTANRLYNKGGALYFNGTVLASAASAGTVSSVAMTVPSILSVAGSPINTSGTLAVTLATEVANTVLAGPTTGADATPTFRALVAADIPNLDATYATASNSMTFTNKSGAISQWTNDAGYTTSSSTGSTNIVTLGTITTGTWHGTVVDAAYGGTGVANSATITLGGAISTASSFTTSGANALTLTTTGATNVTLPTSGTLATTAVTTLSSLTSIGTIATGTWQGTAVGTVYGGTGLTSYTQGDIIYASASNTLSKLAKSTSADRLICNTGASNSPAWCQADLTKAVTGVLPAANGGLGVDTSAVTNGQLLIGKTSDHSLNLATITGTANQVVVTNGAGSITLSTPQSIATASTPQFARLGLATGAGATAVITTTGIFDTGYFSNGNSGSGTVNIDWTSGMTQKITLTGTPTFTIANPVAGTLFTFVLIQDGTGSRTVTWPGTITWKGGSAPTLTATAGKADIIHLLWNGSAYYGYSDLNF